MVDYRKGMNYEQIYGKVKSDEIKNKISKATKGRTLEVLYGENAEKERERRSKRMRGRKNPSKRPEVRKKMSENSKGKGKYYYIPKVLECPCCGKSKEFKFKYEKNTNKCLSNYMGFCSKSCLCIHRNKTKEFIEENAKRSSERLKGKTWVEIYGEEVAKKRKKSISKKLKGTKMGDENPAKRLEVRKKMSESQKGNNIGENNPFFGKKWGENGLRKHPKGMKGKKHTKEFRLKLSKDGSIREKGFSICKFCKKEIESIVRVYEDGRIIPEKKFCSTSCVARNTMTKPIYSMTKPEKQMKKILDKLNINYISQYYVSDIKNRYMADFFIEQYNLIIEVDGVFWHNLKGRKKLDKLRTEQMIKKGYNVLRFNENGFDYDFVKQKIGGVYAVC